MVAILPVNLIRSSYLPVSEFLHLAQNLLQGAFVNANH